MTESDSYTHVVHNRALSVCLSDYNVIIPPPPLRHTIAHCILPRTVILGVGEENANDNQLVELVKREITSRGSLTRAYDFKRL